MRKISVVILIIMFSMGILSGCANIKNDASRTKTEGALTGVGVGAVIGAGLGALVGGVDGALLGASIGGAIGGAAGFAYGSHVAGKKAEYASQEAWLDACIVQAQNVNTEATAYIAELETEIAELDKSTTKLAAEYKSNKASKEYVVAETSKIATKEKELALNLTTLEHEVASQEKVVTDATKSGKMTEVASLNKEIAATKLIIEELKAYQKEMATISARVAV